jgi:hypothetical protein
MIDDTNFSLFYKKYFYILIIKMLVLFLISSMNMRVSNGFYLNKEAGEFIIFFKFEIQVFFKPFLDPIRGFKTSLKATTY